MGINGVNAKRPMPMATANDSVPVSAKIRGRFSSVAAAGVSGVVRPVISEGRIGGTPTASGDQLKPFRSFEINPLFETSVAAIECDVIT